MHPAIRLTTVLLILNVVLFVGLSLMGRADQRAVLSEFAFSTDNLLAGKPWTLVTSLFIHGSLAHLGLNMVALFFFGGALESEVRKRDYLLIYLLGGIAGNLLSAVAFPAGQLSIGASGAIFALTGAAMLVKPFDFVAFPWIIPVPILFVGIVMIVSNFLFFLFPPPDTNISFAAHIGGFTIGLIYGLHKRGFVRGALLLAVGFVVLLLASSLLAEIAVLDYTRAIQILGK